MVAIFTGGGTGFQRGSGSVLGTPGLLGSAAQGRGGESVFVNAANGNLLLQTKDEVLIGRGPDSVLSRVYNSLGGLADDNGDNWRESAQRTVGALSGTVNTAGSTVTLTDWDGSTIRYAWDAARAAYVSKDGAGAYDTLTFAANVWTWTDGGSRLTEQFDSVNGGRITASVDTDGNQLTFSYSGTLLTRVTTASGDYTELSWSGNNLTQIISKTAGGTVLAARTRYQYDASNRLQSVLTDLSPADGVTGDGAVSTISYTYDGTSTRVASISETGAGSLVSFTYVLVGTDYRIATVTEAGSDGVGRTTSFSYDTVNRRTTVTDALGKVTVLGYDADNALTSVTYPPDGTGAAAQMVSYAYNANGDVTAVTDAMGKVTRYSYDANGNLTQERDAAGNTIDRSYGSKNELLTETRYLVPDPDGAGALQPGSPVTKRYAYDGENHLRFAVDADGLVTEYRYNAPGQIVSTISYTANAYDLTGLSATATLAETTLANWVNGLADKSTVQRTDTSYDYRGNVSTVTEYSDLNVNRVQFSQFEQGATGWWAWQYTPGTIQGGLAPGTDAATGKKYIGATFRSTSANDNVGIVSDQLWAATPGERLAVRAGVGSSAGVGSMTLNVQFFDANGGWVTATDVGSLAGPQPFNTTISGFIDVPPNAQRMRLVLYARPSTYNTNLTFTLTEPMIAQVSSLESVIPTFTAGLPQNATPLGGAQSASYSRTSYVYDQYGNLLSRQVSGRAGSEVFTYDGRGRVLTSTDLAGTVTTTVYNDATRSSVTTLANGLVRTSTYTAQGELWSYAEAGTGVTTATESYRYDKLGRLRSTTDALGARDFVFYDDAGRKTGMVDRNGALTEYRYDAADRLVATIGYATALSAATITTLFDASGNPTTATIASVRPTASNADRWEWLVYDTADRVVQRITTVDGGGAAPSGKVVTYEYDGADRLVKTTELATKLSQEVIAGYKTNPPGGANRVYNASFLNPTIGSDGWTNAYNSSGLALAQSSNTLNGVSYFRTNFTATASGQVVSVSTDNAYWWPVTGGERLAIQTGVENQGVVGSMALVLHWIDAAGNALTDQSVTVGTLTGQQTYNSKINGFLNAPAAAAKARLEVYMTTSAAGTGSFGIIQPMVTSATATQTTFPAFDATPPSSAADRTTRSFYGDDGLLIGTLDGDGALVQFEYDKAGRRIRTTAFAALVPPAVRASGGFAAVLGAISPSAADRVDYVVYDGTGQVRYRLDGNLRPTEYVYDAAGAVIRTIDYGAGIAASSRYSEAYVKGQIASLNLLNDGQTRISRTVYDLGGRVGFEIDAEGNVSAYGRDIMSHVVDRTRYVAKYSGTDDPSAATMATWAAANYDNGNRVERFLYDPLGRLVYEMDAGGYVAEHQYDLDDRVIRDIRYAAPYTLPWGETIATLAALSGALPADAVVTSYAYDAAGNVIDTWDGEGNRTHRVYTAFGQAWQVIEAYGTADAAETRFQYDAAGRMVAKSTAFGAAEQANTAYAYDGIGNLIAATDPRGNTTSYSYDAVGNRLTETVPLTNSANAVTSYQYDAFGNVVKVTDPRGYASYSYYDKLNRAVLAIDAEGYATQTSYTIDNQIASTTRYYTRASGIGNVAVPPTLTPNAKDATTRLERDKLGRVTKVIDAEGFFEQYTLNAFGDRVAVKSKTSGGKDNNDAGGVTTNVFDKRGLLIRETLPVGSTRGDGTVQAANIVNTYAYDARGNRIQRIEAAGLAEQRTTTYKYDKNNRLTSQSGDAVTTYSVTTFTGAPNGTVLVPTTSYTYDLRGNRTSVQDASGAITYSYYDDNDRKIAEISPVGALSTWTYDPNGNVLTARTYADALTTAPSDINGQAAQVYRLYDLVLGRFPNAAEVANWVYRMSNLGAEYPGFAPTPAEDWAGYPWGQNMPQLEAIAGDIMHASTGLSVSDTSTFINNLYLAAFRRPAQPAEITVWTDNLANGWTRGGLIACFCEYYGHRAFTDSRIAPSFAGGTPPAPPAGAYRESSFTYDKANRQVTSTVGGVFTGSYAAGYGVADLVTASTYDASGNVITVTDPNGGKTYFWFDALSRKTAQVDAAGALTTWVYDPDGNVTEERRFANRVNTQGGAQVTLATLVSTGSSSALPALTASAGYSDDDRITAFTYDLVGNRLSETRYNLRDVLVSGSATPSTGYTAATVRYLYNGLGQVVRKTEATQEQTNYSYDAAGRLITEARAAFTDFTGQSVTPTTRYRYDGLGNLARTVQEGANGVAARTTTYSYGAGGRLASMTDASGFTRSYAYDVMGRVTKESYTRATASGGAVTDAIVSRYDLAGRTIYQGTATWNGASFVMLDYNETRYNGLGDVVKQGVNGLFQTENRYDKAGRLSATTAGDGVWKLFGYDRNGNQTVAITSAGTSLAGQSLEGALAQVGSATVNATYTSYDQRNLAVQVIEEGRELSATTTDQLVTTRGYTAFGEVASETNALGATISYSYNTMGKLVKLENPTVAITLEDGTVQTVRPTELFYYDESGRMTGSRSANGALTRQTLLAGTGYGGGAALTVASIGADGGVLANAYDIHGDIRRITDQVGRVTTQTFDAMGRAIEVVNPGGLVESYAYDGLGQRIQTWNNQFQTPVYGAPQQVWVADPPSGYWQQQTPIIGYNPATPIYGEPESVWVPDGGHWEQQTPIIGYNPEQPIYGEPESVWIANPPSGHWEKQTPIIGYTPQQPIYGEPRLVWIQDWYGGGNPEPQISLFMDADVPSDSGGGHYEWQTPIVGYTPATPIYGKPVDVWVADPPSGRWETQTPILGYTPQTPIYGQTVSVWVPDSYSGHWAEQTPLLGYAPETPIYGPTVSTWVQNPATGHFETQTPFLGYAPEKALTDYDAQGRVISQRAFGGDVTTVSYAWNAGIATNGVGSFGGWAKTTTFANGKQAVESTDSFGRATAKTDLGGHVWSYSYDVAGRLSAAGTSSLTTYYQYFNSGLVRSTIVGALAPVENTSWSRTIATYSYDKLGQKLTEQTSKEEGVYIDGHWAQEYEPGYPYPYDSYWVADATYTVNATSLQNSTVSYDALGRLKTFTEAGSAVSPAASITYDYDANGNIRRTTASYRTLDQQGNASGAATTTDYWFRYDSMNRMVTDRGVLRGGQIVRGEGSGSTAGQDIRYNAAGERVAVIRTVYSPGQYNFGQGDYYDNYYNPGYYYETRETYVYDAAGRLAEVRQTQGTGVAESDGYSPPASLPAASDQGGVVRSRFGYDTIGRQTSQTDYAENGSSVIFSRTATYNTKSQLSFESTVTWKSDNHSYRSDTTYTYGSGADYALGSALSISTVTARDNDDGAVPDTLTTNSYYWWDGAVQAGITHRPDTSKPTSYTTSFSYNGIGQLTSAYVGDGRPRSVSFRLSAEGQILRRDESDNSANGDPHEVWYRFNGRQLGYTGNNGTSDVSLADSIGTRALPAPGGTPGAFRGGQSYGQAYADFAGSYDPINSYAQGSGGGSYTVRTGDTLAGIAQSVWGDASLWYKLAEANGLSGAAALTAGTTLILPAGVLKSGFNASTATPYE